MSNLVPYIGIFLGISGVFLTIYGIRKTLEKKLPRLYCSHFEKIALSDKPIEDVIISYRGNTIERVTSSLIWFWNAGRRPIIKSDVPETQPILVDVSENDKDISILDIQVKKVSRPSTKFSFTRKSDSRIKISFDFLDYKDGTLIEVLHTGSVFASINVSGVILGCPDGVRLMEPFSRVFALYPGGTLMFRLTHPVLDRSLRIILSLLWIITAGYFLWSKYKGGNFISNINIFIFMIVIIFFLIIIRGFFRAITRPLYSIPRSLSPRTKTNKKIDV